MLIYRPQCMRERSDVREQELRLTHTVAKPLTRRTERAREIRDCFMLHTRENVSNCCAFMWRACHARERERQARAFTHDLTQQLKSNVIVIGICR